MLTNLVRSTLVQKLDRIRRRSAIIGRERSVYIRITSGEHSVKVFAADSSLLHYLSAQRAAVVSTATAIDYAYTARQNCPAGIIATDSMIRVSAHRTIIPCRYPGHRRPMMDSRENLDRKNGRRPSATLVGEPLNRCRFTVSLGITLTDNFTADIIIFNVIPILTRGV